MKKIPWMRVSRLNHSPLFTTCGACYLTVHASEENGAKDRALD
jgi:hypothetical protein